MKENNTKQQIFKEDFRKNFAAAKELSEIKEKEKREKAFGMAENLFQKHRVNLVSMPLIELNKELSKYQGKERKIEISINIPLSFEEINQMTLEMLKCKTRNELIKEISQMIGDDEYDKIEVSYSAPSCGWNKEIKFLYTFSF